MLNLNHATINTLAVHHVGNKVNEEQMHLSEDNTYVDKEVLELLSTYFLKPFKDPIYFRFDHHNEMSLQVVYHIAKSFFARELSLYESSVKLANHLYEISEHPNIKGGEFYCVYIENCVVEGEEVNALGLFKSENKETFLKVMKEGSGFDMDAETGININKLDKGCIIFNAMEEDGYRMCIVDKTNPNKDAVYWTDTFLQSIPVEDEFFQTKNYLDICKGFVSDVFNSENDVERTDQIDFLNRSMDYFKGNDHFREDKFEEEVMMGESGLVEAFKDYKEDYKTQNQLDVNDDFSISDVAVKKSRKDFKSVLKLDRNFHIYIHGRRDYIEKYYDHEKGLNYYKVYFDKEY